MFIWDDKKGEWVKTTDEERDTLLDLMSSMISRNALKKDE